jgi:hypothetical protein
MSPSSLGIGLAYEDGQGELMASDKSVARNTCPAPT